ncbi:hypothetical protein ACNA4Z_25100 [Klebsiella pneumoniae]
MTDITELAQREKFEAWVMTQICISKSTLEGLRTSVGYRNSTLSGSDYNLMWNLWKAAGAELVEALEKAQAATTQQGNIASALLDEVTQLRRHADEKAPELRALLIEADSELEVLRQRIADLESRLNSAEKLQDSAFRSGLQHGFSLGQTDDEKGYEQSMDAYSLAAGIKREAE